jgi:hypothetical protein
MPTGHILETDKPAQRPLPDSAKLRRAAELFEETVKATLALLREGKGVRESRPMAGVITYEFPPAPERLRLLLGDCFQSLRSALDHEVFALTAARHGRIWADQANTAFPIAMTAQAFKSQGLKQIRGLNAQAQGLIGTLQPFQQPGHLLAPALAFVHDVARVDRHRLLNLAAVQPREVDFNQVSGRINLKVELRFVLSEFSGRDALGEARSAITVVAWTIDELRAAEKSEPAAKP